MTRTTMTGNDAAAEAMKQCRPDVAAVYPITPQTEMMHKFSEFVFDGVVNTELVAVESEHSAMSACVGAAASGARVGTATSANGLALMFEITYIASSLRLPIVMAVINRALSGPINIHCDHSDSMGCRDAGWIQFHSENTQEVYDNIIQAFKIAENPEVLLPVMLCYDGFIISHTVEVLDILSDEQVWGFVGEYKPERSLLDTENPITFGPLDLQDYYFEHKRQQWQAHRDSIPVIKKVGEQFGREFGRTYGFIEKYRMEDAEVAVICLGSTAGTTKYTVDLLRERGLKVGMVKIRCFRPFPVGIVAQALNNVHSVLVLDRSIAFGTPGGPLYLEVRNALYDRPAKPLVFNYIYGLGGRDINTGQIAHVFEKHLDKTGDIPPVGFIGLRE